MDSKTQTAIVSAGTTEPATAPPHLTELDVPYQGFTLSEFINAMELLVHRRTETEG
jgi:hypothetical protein